MSWTVEDNSTDIKFAISNITQAGLEEIASEIESQAASNTRVATGKTRSRWGHNTFDTQAVIGNAEENAIWEEYGTGEYALNGNGRKGEWYVMIGYGKNQMTPQTVERYGFKIVYGKGGKKYAVVRGKKPTRALYKAFTQTKPNIESAFNAKFKEL